MSNIPVFYVDEVMHLISGEELKVLMFMAHKIIGEQLPFDGEQFAYLSIEDLENGTGVRLPKLNQALTELVQYSLIMPAQTDQGPAWMLCPLDDVDLAGLAARDKARKK